MFDIDALPMLVGATLVGAGWLLGRHARLKSVRGPEPVQPFCLCDHSYGHHDPKTGACNESTVCDFRSAEKGRYQRELACGCVRYTGPQPVESYWVPPAADMSIVTAPIERPGKDVA